MVNRRTRKAALLVAMGVLAAVALAHVALAWVSQPAALARGTCTNYSADGTIWCGIPDGSRHSGTCGSVRGKWLSAWDGSVKKVELWVNGVRRYQREWTSDYPDMYPPGDTCQSWLATPYSTTQFGNGTTLTFKAKLWTTNNNYYEGTDPRSHITRNRSYSLWSNYVDQSAQNCATAADNCCAACNHTAYGPYNTHFKSNIENYLPQRNVFYICTHASSAGFGDCFYDPGNPSDDRWLTALEVRTALGNRSDTEPHYNFVFIDGCRSGWKSPGQPYQILYYTGFRCVGDATCQAYLGWWDWVPDTPASSDWSIAFWNALQSKKTIDQAIEAADQVNREREGKSAVYGSVGRSYRLHYVY